MLRVDRRMVSNVESGHPVHVWAVITIFLHISPSPANFEIHERTNPRLFFYRKFGADIRGRQASGADLRGRRATKRKSSSNHLSFKARMGFLHLLVWGQSHLGDARRQTRDLGSNARTRARAPRNNNLHLIFAFLCIRCCTKRERISERK
jgi:hypothetical protein